jgi:hypothetical protein
MKKIDPNMMNPDGTYVWEKDRNRNIMPVSRILSPGERPPRTKIPDGIERGRGRISPLRGSQGGRRGRGIAGLKIENPKSVIRKTRKENENALRRSTPNVETMGGRREIIYNDDGTSTIRETLDPATQGAWDARQDFITGASRKAGELMNNIGEFNPGAYKDPRAGQRGLPSMQALQQLPNWQDPRAGLRFDMPQNFSQERDTIYNNMLADYERNTAGDRAQRRERELQLLVNSGNGPGSAAYNSAMERLARDEDNSKQNLMSQAYRDAGGEQSRMFQDSLQGRNQQFGENMQAMDQRFNQGFQANNQNMQYQDMGFNQAIQANEMNFNQNLATNDQQFNQEYQKYRAPIDAYTAVAPQAGQYDRPDFGDVQKYTPMPTDIAGISRDWYKMRQDREMQERELANRMAVTGANNGAAMARLDRQRQYDLEDAGYQFAISGGY